MKLTHQRQVTIAILLNINLLLAGCYAKSDITAETIDSLKAINSPQLKISIDTVLIKGGKILFKTNCSSCHAIFKTDNYLQGVVQRVGENYLKLYLTKQDSLIKANDRYALELKKTFGNLGNSHNFDFSDEQLNAIISYLKKYSS